MAQQTFDALMKKARKTNTERDADERAGPFAAVSDIAYWLQIRTAMSAIEAGIRAGDQNCLAEALAMLEGVWPAVQEMELAKKVMLLS